MFQKKYRLPANTRLQNPATLFTPFFSVKIAKNNLEINRYGFIVSKKIDKRAVVRNRIKRRIRTGVEQLQKEINPGYDVLFFIKKEAIAQDTPILWQAIREMLIKKIQIKSKQA